MSSQYIWQDFGKDQGKILEVSVEVTAGTVRAAFLENYARDIFDYVRNWCAFWNEYCNSVPYYVVTDNLLV